MTRQSDIDDANKEENKLKEGGMKWERTCTDVMCCIVFMVFLVTMVGLSFLALTQGDPMRMVTPFDSVGNLCGANAAGQNQTFTTTRPVALDLTAYPYKFFTNLQDTTSGSSDMYNAVCVKECPKAQSNFGESVDCTPNADVKTCPGALFATKPLAKTCFPDGEVTAKIIEQLLKELDSKSGFSKYIVELQMCWQVVVGMCFGSFVIAAFYIFLLKWLTKPLLYISMFIIFLGFGLLGGWLWLKKADYSEEVCGDVKGEDGKTTNVCSKPINYQYCFYGAIVAWVVDVIYMMFICCCWKNISLGASIMECASQFVASTLRVILLPIGAYLVCAPFVAYWTVTAVYLYSMGTPEFQEDSFISNIKWEDQTRYLIWYFVFALCWCLAFIICLQQFMIAATVCQWYYSGQGEEMADCPYDASVYRSFKWGIWYNCGSVAFGSFVIALVSFIRIVFEYLVKQYEAVGNKENPVYKAVKCYIRYYLWCLDKYVKMISKNAFIQISLRSCTFCTGAWDSFFLMIRHAGRFGSASIIGWIMMILGKGTITGVSMYLTFLFVGMAAPDVQQPLVPAALVGIVAYVVGSLFLSIFSFSSTAILHCFIMNEDVGGSDITPDSLQGFLTMNEARKAKDEAFKKIEDPETNGKKNSTAEAKANQMD